MRKKPWWAIASLMVMLIICSCGNTAEGEQKEPVNQGEQGSENTDQNDEAVENEEAEVQDFWARAQVVDEFGDAVEDAEAGMTAVAVGDFSNTATTSSELIVKTQLLFMGDEPVFCFIPLEYGNNPATFLKSDSITMKIKVEDQISEVGLETSGAPNLYTGVMKYYKQGRLIFNPLKNGKDVRCIIYIGSSQYNFTLESDNFAECLFDVFPDKAEAFIKDDSAEAVSFDSAEVGDIVTFGSMDGEGIAWRVLDKQDSKVLLLSDYILFENSSYKGCSNSI